MAPDTRSCRPHPHRAVGRLAATSTDPATPSRPVVEARALALDRPADAIEPLAGLAAAAIAADRWADAASARTGEAWARREVYDHAGAATAIEEALGCAARLDDPAPLAEAHTVRAMIELEKGDTARARADLDRALALGGAAPAVRFAAAVVADHAGLLAEAAAMLDDVIVDPACPDEVRLKALNNLGSMLVDMGSDRAVPVLERAAGAAGGSAHLAAIIGHNLGCAHATAGRVPAALAAFADAEARLVDLGGPVSEHLLEVGKLLGRLRLLPEARRSLDRALALLDGEGAALVRADALALAARLARADGDDDGAADHERAATALYRDQDRPHGLAALALDRAASPDEVVDAARVLASLGRTREAAAAHLLAGELWLRSDDPRALDQLRHPLVQDDAVDAATRTRAAALVASRTAPTEDALTASRGLRSPRSTIRPAGATRRTSGPGSRPTVRSWNRSDGRWCSGRIRRTSSTSSSGRAHRRAAPRPTVRPTRRSPRRATRGPRLATASTTTRPTSSGRSWSTRSPRSNDASATAVGRAPVARRRPLRTGWPVCRPCWPAERPAPSCVRAMPPTGTPSRPGRCGRSGSVRGTTSSPPGAGCGATSPRRCGHRRRRPNDGRAAARSAWTTWWSALW